MRLLPSYCCIPLPHSAGNEAGGRLGEAGNEAGGRLGIHKVQYFTNVVGLCNFGHTIHDHHQFRDHKLQVMPVYTWQQGSCLPFQRQRKHG